MSTTGSAGRTRPTPPGTLRGWDPGSVIRNQGPLPCLRVFPPFVRNVQLISSNKEGVEGLFMPVSWMTHIPPPRSTWSTPLFPHSVRKRKGPSVPDVSFVRSVNTRKELSRCLTLDSPETRGQDRGREGSTHLNPFRKPERFEEMFPFVSVDGTFRRQTVICVATRCVSGRDGSASNYSTPFHQGTCSSTVSGLRVSSSCLPSHDPPSPPSLELNTQNQKTLSQKRKRRVRPPLPY